MRPIDSIAPPDTEEAPLARAFIVGNGSILAAGDGHGSLRELYAPSVSPENQILRRPARVGVTVDGTTRWVGPGFEARLGDGGDAPIVGIALVSAALEVELWIETFVDATLGVVVRRVQVTNTSERFRDLRLLFHHDFGLSVGPPLESAHHDPGSGGVVHHAGRRFALVNFEGPDGTGAPLWRVESRAVAGDPGAEHLPPGGRIESAAEVRGIVDSIVAAPLPLAPGASALVTATIATGDTYRSALDRDEAFRRGGASSSRARTRAHWTLWTGAGERDLLDLPEDVATVFNRSLVLLRLHQTPTGAILSGVESAPAARALSEYRWCWHRDAAIAADALGRAGYASATRRYLELALRSCREAGGFAPVVDASGAEAPAVAAPDAAALLLWCLARHFERERDAEFVAPLYRELVVPLADFLTDSIDPATDLPESSGRWSDRMAFHAPVAAAVRAGLLAAARLADAFSEGERSRAWSETADRIARAMGRDLHRAEWGRFARALTKDGRVLRPDPSLDASLLLLGLFGEFEVEDPRIRGTVDEVRAGLWVRTGVGGIARFEHDPLGAVGTAEIPGNPWIETTLWLAQHSVRAAKRAQELDGARTILLWCAARAEGWGGLPEQLHPYRGETTATAPSMAAHAWFVATVVDYVGRLRHLRRCERCGVPAPALRAERAHTRVEGSLPGLVGNL